MRPKDIRRRKERGQFFTPEAAADELLAEAEQSLAEAGLALPAEGPVLDPACGGGAFLRAAAARGWAGPLCGLDLDEGVLDGPAGARLQVTDGLVDPNRHGARAVVANPPFGGRGVRDRSPLQLEALGRDYGIWRADARGRERDDLPIKRLATFEVSTLFVETFVRALRPGGLMATVLPIGFVANGRTARPRAWLLRHLRLLSVSTLGGSTFASTGTRARTVFVVGVRRHVPLVEAEQAAADGPVRLLGGPGDPWERALPVAELLRAGRWDPRYHDPRWSESLERCQLPLRPLGDFVSELTYGGIAPGQRPQLDPTGVPYVTQRAVRDWGVDLDACPRIRPAEPFARARYRLQPGDLVVPRSGAGSLGRNRLCRWDGEPGGGVVDCFTDRVSLEGISSAWVLGVLRSPLGWHQIQRTFNGVGTPNLSFGEIRALQVPVPTIAMEAEAEALWADIAARRGDVSPLVRAVLRRTGSR